MSTPYRQQYQMLPGLGSTQQVSQEPRFTDLLDEDPTRRSAVARSSPGRNGRLREAYEQNNFLPGLSIHTAPSSSLPAPFDLTDEYGRSIPDPRFVGGQIQPSDLNDPSVDRSYHQLQSRPMLDVNGNSSFFQREPQINAQIAFSGNTHSHFDSNPSNFSETVSTQRSFPPQNFYNGAMNERNYNREVARKAIKDLHDYGISYNQIVHEEGVEFEALVAQLWGEFGFPIPNPTKTVTMLEDRIESINTVQKPINDRRVASEALIQPQPIHLPTHSFNTLSTNLTSEYRNGEVNQAPLAAVVDQQKTTTIGPTSTKPINLPSPIPPQPSQASNTADKMTVSSTSKSAQPVMEERKDKIKRLMAQKASKAGPKPPSLASGSSAPELNLQQPLSQITRQIDLPTSPSLTQPGSKTWSDIVKPTGSTASVNAQIRKNKATELALRKIEEQKMKFAQQKQLASVPTGALQSSNTEQSIRQTGESPAIEELRSFSHVQFPEETIIADSRALNENRDDTMPQLSPFGIPGLFMAPKKPEDVAVARPPDSPATPTDRSRFKRPVAADFDDDYAQYSSDPKRPFGHLSKQSRVVINVSDDESSSESDDHPDNSALLFDTGRGNGSSGFPGNVPNSAERREVARVSIRDQPPLTDYPRRSRHNKSVEMQGSFTGGQQFKKPKLPMLAYQEEEDQRKMLQAKEDEIRMMNEKIARLEKAKQSRGGSITPASSSQLPQSRTPLATQTIPNVSNSSHVQVEPPVDLTRPQSAPLTKAEITGEIEAKKARKAKLEAEILSMNASMDEAKSKAEALRLESQRWEAIANSRETFEKRQRLMKELEDFGIEVTETNIARLENHQEHQARQEINSSSSMESGEISAENSPNGEAQTADIQMADATIPGESPISIDSITPGSNSLQSPPDANGDAQSSGPDPKSSNDLDSLEDGEMSEGSRNSSGHSSNQPIASQAAAARLSSSSFSPPELPDKDDITMVEAGDNHAVGEINNTTESQSDSDYEPPEEITGAPVDVGTCLIDAQAASDPLANTLQANIESSDNEYEPPLPPELIDMDSSKDLEGTTEIPGLDSEAPPKSVEAGNVSFVPYSSPLRLFRAYRTHRAFLSDIEGGFQSLTYNNDIDSQKTFCPSEILSGTCEDPACKLQHLRDIHTSPQSDQKFLESITTPYPGRNEAEQREYAEGLAELIAHLSTTENPFQVVADAIVKYRRKFSSDPSKLMINWPPQ